jgi:hypothetical protein
MLPSFDEPEADPRILRGGTRSSAPLHDVEDEDGDEEEVQVENEDDIVWVIVVRGRQTALALFLFEWLGSLISFSLVTNVGIPAGSGFLFATNLIIFATSGLFLIPPFLRRFPARYRDTTRSRVLVLFSVGWSGLFALLTFASAVVASRAFVECRSLSYTGQCSRVQAAIAISFVVSFALAGSFFVSFLGSVVPRDITVKTYIKGLARAAALRAAGSGRRFETYDGFDSVPLNVMTTRRSSSSLGAIGTPLGRKRSDSQAQTDTPMHTKLKSNSYSEDADDKSSVDAMEII